MAKSTSSAMTTMAMPMVVVMLVVGFVSVVAGLPSPSILLTFDRINAGVIPNFGTGPVDVSARVSGASLISVIGRGLPGSTNALSLSGAGDHAVFTDSSVLTLQPRTAAYTISMWVRLRRTDNIQTIFARGTELFSQQALILATKPGGVLATSVGGSSWVSGTGIVGVNSWFMLTATNAKNSANVWTFSLYLNSGLLASGLSGTSTTPSTAMIGARRTSANAIAYPMTGYVDNFAFYPSALTSLEVDELYRISLQISATPTPPATSSVTAAPSESSAPTSTASESATVTVSESASSTISGTVTSSETASSTATVTSSPSATRSQTAAPTGTPTGTSTPSSSVSESSTGSISESPSSSISGTLSSSKSASFTGSGSSTTSTTPSQSVTRSQSVAASVTATVSSSTTSAPSSSSTGSASTSWSGTPASTPSNSGTPSISPSTTRSGSVTASLSMNTTPTRTSSCSAPASPTADPFYSNVFLLLPFDAMLGAKVPDYSLNAMTATPNGGFTLAPAPALFGPSVAVFDGVNSYLTLDHPSHGMSTGDFTTELWIRPDDACLECMVLASATGALQLYYQRANVLELWLSTAGHAYDIVYGLDVGVYVNPLEWHHVVFGRQGSVFSSFFDGVSVAQVTSSAAIEDSQLLFGTLGGLYLYRGAMDDFRLTQGVTRYTSSFCVPGALPRPAIPSRSSSPSLTASRSPPVSVSVSVSTSYSQTTSRTISITATRSPTATRSLFTSPSSTATCVPQPSQADPYLPSVHVQLNFDALGGGGKVVDSSTHGYTATPGGSFAISNSVVKFGSGSGYFDGVSSAVTVDTASHGMAGGDFTTDLWMRTIDGCLQCMVFSAGIPVQLYFQTANVLRVWISTSGSAYDILNAVPVGPSVDVNLWHHVVIQRSGTLFTTYFNGLQIATATSAGVIPDTSIAIGTLQNNYRFRGYIDDFRVTSGVARYASSFCFPIDPTPSGTPNPTPTPSVNSDPFYAQTYLSYSFDAIVNSRVPDGGRNGYYGVPEAGFALSTTIVRSGVAAGYFSGSTAVVSSVASTGIATGDFTIEMWARTVDSCANCMLMSSAPGSIQIYFPAANQLKIWISSSGTLYDIASGLNIASSFPANQWHHVAVTRSGTTFRTFFNGAFVASLTSSSAIGSGAYYLGRYSQTGYYFRGYIDEFRVTTAARYTSSFTPQ